MPGELKAEAVCPLCGEDLICIVDESNLARVRREYFHGKPTWKARRKRRCVRVFADHDAAARERKALEVVTHFAPNEMCVVSCHGSGRRARAKRLEGR
jgi:hypothetical protein